MQRHVRIAGIGTYLPSQVRTNEWWPSASVDRWLAARHAAPSPPLPALTPAMRRVLEAVTHQAVDPFQGAVERRVLAEEESAEDMEVEAARRALTNARLAPSDIGLLLVHSPVPEYLLSNPACALHERLGLAPDCMTMQLDAAGNSFVMQLAVAERMLSGGAARHALLVQSALGSRLVDKNEPESPMFGDGAAATVVSLGERPGILASEHRTDGRHPRALVATVPGGRWYDGGKVVLHRGDLLGSRLAFLKTADQALSVIEPALAKAGIDAGEVDFFAVHQGTPWLREVTMDLAGLKRARYVDMFSETAYLFGASIPFVLERAELRDGDRVLILGGGVGATIAAIVMVWTK